MNKTLPMSLRERICRYGRILLRLAYGDLHYVDSVADNISWALLPFRAFGYIYRSVVVYIH